MNESLENTSNEHIDMFCPFCSSQVSSHQILTDILIRVKTFRCQVYMPQFPVTLYHARAMTQRIVSKNSFMQMVLHDHFLVRPLLFAVTFMFRVNICA